MNDLIATTAVLIASVLGALGLFYRNVRETQTIANAAAELLREKEQERIAKVFDLVQKELNRTAERLDATETECAALRTQQNSNIREIAVMSHEVEMLLQDNTRLTNEVNTLRAQLANKDKVIQEQDVQIKKQGKRIGELETEYGRVQAQVNLLVQKLKEAEIPLPDGLEGNTE